MLYSAMLSIEDRRPAISVSHLVPDVLVKIFRLVKDNDIVYKLRSCSPYNVLKGGQFSWIPYPLPLSHVCKNWRHTVISTPSLWTELYVFPPWNFRITTLFLERSNPCSIDLYVWVMLGHFHETYLKLKARTGKSSIPVSSVIEGNTEKARTMFSLFEQHSQRYRKVVIQTDYLFQNVFNAFVDHVTQNMASLVSLQQLHLQEIMVPNEGEPYPIQFTKIPHIMPALVDLKLASSVEFPPPSYSRLRALHIHLAHFVHGKNNFLNIISQCRALETLALYDDTAYDRMVEIENHPGNNAIALPFLSSLQLYGMNCTNISHIFSFISTPKLDHLVIAPFPHVYSRWPLHRFDKFNTVKSLVLALRSDGDLYIGAAIDWAANWLPCIEEALFVGVGAPILIDNALRNMNPSDDNDKIWPQLRSLAIRTPLRDPLLLFSSREAIGCPICRLYADRKTLEAQPELLRLDRGNLEVVERDVWKELREDGLFPISPFGAGFVEL